MNIHSTRQGIPLRPDRDAVAAEWRRDFVQNATINVLARMRRTNADEIRLELRSPVEPMKASALPGGTVAALMALAPQSPAARLFEQAPRSI